MKKSTLAVPLTLMIILGQVSPVVHAEGVRTSQLISKSIVDKIAPIFTAITVDGKESGKIPEKIAGDYFNIYVDATDDSGVASGYVTYQNENSGKLMEVALKYDTTTKRLVGKVRTPPGTHAGLWKPIAVSLTDTLGNLASYNDKDKYENGSFTLTGDEAKHDTQGPIFNNISTDKPTGTKGDSIKVVVDASDVSGITRATVSYQNKMTYDSKEVELSPLESGKLEGVFEIDELTKNGDWEITSIDVTDTYDNTTYVTKSATSRPIFAKATITVHDSNTDVIAPIIHMKTNEKLSDKLLISQNEGKANDVITFTLKDVIDPSKDPEDTNKPEGTPTGVAGALLAYENEISHQTVEIPLELKDNGTLSGDFHITPDTHNGSWKLTGITIIDNSNNQRLYYNDLDFATITIHDANTDLEAPVFKSIQVNNEDDFSPGSKVTFAVEATDVGSGIKEATLMYMNPSLTRYVPIILTFDEASKTFKGEFNVGEYTDKGIWRTGGIILVDNAGNTTVEDSLDNAEFSVIGTKIDMNNPTISDYEIEQKSVVRHGDTIYLKVKATDEESGVQGVLAIFHSGTQNSKNNLENKNFNLQIGDELNQVMLLEYNNDTGFYEGDFKIDPMMAYGDWILDGFLVADGADNITSLEVNYAFHVKETIIKDLTIKTDKPNVTVGDKVSITLTPDEKYKNIKNVEATFNYVTADRSTQTSDSTTQNVSFTYNEKAGVYEGSLLVTENMQIGTWKLGNVTLTDVENHVDMVDDLSTENHTFTVIEKPITPTTPTDPKPETPGEKPVTPTTPTDPKPETPGEKPVTPTTPTNSKPSTPGVSTTVIPVNNNTGIIATSSPKTGDTSNTGLYITLMFGSILSLALLRKWKLKKN